MSVPCPACKRRGWIMACVDGRDPDTGEAAGALAPIKCLTCGGSGEIDEDHSIRISLGEALRDWRKQLGLSLREAARAMGLTDRQMSDLEHGRKIA